MKLHNRILYSLMYSIFVWDISLIQNGSGINIIQKQKSGLFSGKTVKGWEVKGTRGHVGINITSNV